MTRRRTPPERRLLARIFGELDECGLAELPRHLFGDEEEIARMATERLAAEQRAHALLRTLLSDGEYQQVLAQGYLEVRSPSKAYRVYHIPRGGGFIEVYDRNRPVMSLCVQPTEPLPADDLIILHKLMIEGDEVSYLRHANRFPPHGITRQDIAAIMCE